MERGEGQASSKGFYVANARFTPREWEDVRVIREYLCEIGVTSKVSTVSKAIRYATRLVAGMVRRKHERGVKHEQA